MSATILVVDDDGLTLTLVERTLRAGGYRVWTAGGAPEARRLLQELAGAVDLVLTDIAMPEQDGYSFIRQVRSLPRDKGGDTPAAALTAYARDIDRRQALAAGYQMHIAKPIGASQLVTMIARLAGREN